MASANWLGADSHECCRVFFVQDVGCARTARHQPAMPLRTDGASPLGWAPDPVAHLVRFVMPGGGLTGTDTEQFSTGAV